MKMERLKKLNAFSNSLSLFQEGVIENGFFWVQCFLIDQGIYCVAINKLKFEYLY